MAISLSWSSAFRTLFLILLVTAISLAFISLPLEKLLKDFLLWVEKDLGFWGPLVLTVTYIPLTILAVPASILTLGGGYLFGLPVGFAVDSIGGTAGATAAFLLGRTIGRSYVTSILNKFPKFQAIAIAIERSGFKIVLLLRLIPLLPFNMLNYLIAVTPISLGEYVLATWIGTMPQTFVLVYVGTTLKDLSDITNHDWSEFSLTHWMVLAVGFTVSVMIMIYISRLAKLSLENALITGNMNNSHSPQLSSILTLSYSSSDLHKPLLTMQETPAENIV
ncbi:TVP38/TMEM64 family membrane protein slr0305 [Impatiens glandulifera]|uniref:TVP38/TMEM64 family membrane protein slr0305 n=1 Tax=Impatiens glandulifera TaxID=253017 RepID=UPI001FB096BA|nr:TVP38/TMEM64 family membrane protein slr0305 [Impatiens glandulifera]